MSILISLLRIRRKHSKFKHKAIIQAANISHAQELQTLFNSHEDNKNEFFATAIASRDEEDALLFSEKDARLEAFENDKYDAIIHYGLIEEGYDNPYISIVAIFYVIASQTPYTQIVGRALRRIPDENSLFEDNVAIILTHSGLGLKSYWESLLEDKTSLKKAKGKLKYDKNKKLIKVTFEEVESIQVYTKSGEESAIQELPSLTNQADAVLNLKNFDTIKFPKEDLRRELLKFASSSYHDYKSNHGGVKAFQNSIDGDPSAKKKAKAKRSNAEQNSSEQEQVDSSSKKQKTTQNADEESDGEEAATTSSHKK